MQEPQAIGIAESGLRLAIAALERDPDWRSNLTHGAWLADHAFGAGTFRLRFEDETDGDLADEPADAVAVTAIGSFDGAAHKIRAVVSAAADGLSMSLNVDDEIIINSDSCVDSFDSRNGAYGPSNRGQDATATTNSTNANTITINSASCIRGDVLVGPGGDPKNVISNPGDVSGSTGVLPEPIVMPTVVEPSHLGPNVGDLDYDGGHFTINTDVHAQKLQIQNSATVRIVGDVTMLIEDEFIVNSEAQVLIAPGGSLTLYVKGPFTLNSESRIVQPPDPSAVTVYMLGTSDAMLNSKCEMYGVIVAPFARLIINSESHFYGRFIGRGAEINSDSGFHQDINPSLSAGLLGKVNYAVRWCEQP